MKKIFVILFLLTGSLGMSQSVNYDHIIPLTNSDTLSISEKLVQLAWNNYPNNEALQLAVESSKKDVKLAKLQWTNNITANFNANDASIYNGLFKKYDPTATIAGPGGTAIAVPFYPRYNFGIGLSLGTFVLTPTNVNKNKIAVKINESKVKTQKLSIRAEVLRRYQAYLTSIEVLKLRVKALEEAHLIHLLVTKKFKKGESLLEDYNKSFLTYNNAQEAKVHAESDVYFTKTTLEEMIGVKLEEVTGNKYENQRVDKKGDTLITPSGLKYVVIEPGFGEKPKSGQTVKVFYTGKFLNGKEFENNLKDDPFRITLGVQQVIQGWEEGILLMREGEKGTLIIPARLAYGHQGIKDPSNDGAYLVPPDTPVIYEIELVDVK